MSEDMKVTAENGIDETTATASEAQGADAVQGVSEASEQMTGADAEGSANEESGDGSSKDTVMNKAVSEDEDVATLLKAILKQDKKEVTYARFAALFTLGIFLVILIAVIIILPQVTRTLDHVNDAVSDAMETLESANKAMEEINEMTGSITNTSENMNQMLTDNSESLTDAVKKIEDIDFEGLNQAIQDLQDAVGPFATFMNRFR